jgi:hypothetical protein
VVAQLPPVVVSVNVAVPKYAAGGVHVALRVVAFGVKVPPETLEDQIPPVAVPPTLPPNAAEVPPWQIAAKAAPGFAVAIQPGLNANKIAPLLALLFRETVPFPVAPAVALIAQAPPIPISRLALNGSSNCSASEFGEVVDQELSV